jgi:hypothetical protein
VGKLLSFESRVQKTIAEIARELRGRQSRRAQFEEERTHRGEKFEAEARKMLEALKLMEDLTSELNSPRSKERDGKCVTLSAALLQRSIDPNWPITPHPTTIGRLLRPGKWQALFETTRAVLATKLCEEMSKRSLSDPKDVRFVSRLSSLEQRITSAVLRRHKMLRAHAL